MIDAQDLLHTPEGVRDSYGPENSAKQQTIRKIQHVIHMYGYEDLQTPSFEFFDVFSNEIGTTPSKDLYKFFDKEGNTLVLRPDFTPSVARCAAKYFMDEKRPLRFCYGGSAFANTSELQGKLKETTQMGAELMNDASVKADAEMIAMLAEALRASGLKNFQISVGNVEYFKGICESLGLSSATEVKLREAISGKNYFAAEDLLMSEGYDKAQRDLFLNIRDFCDTVEDLVRLKAAAPSERAANAIQRLIDLWNVLEMYGLSEYVSYDLSLLSKYHYYTGVIFKGFTYGTGEPIASGGRYDQLLSYFGKNDAPAIGWMITVDSLMEALRRQQLITLEEDPVTTLFYTEENYGEMLVQARKNRSDGIRTVLVPAEA